MLSELAKKIRRRFRRSSRNFEIDPDEILIDSRNLPNFDTDQFEGRLEKPISKKVMVFSGIIFVLLCLAIIGRVWNLQIKKGEAYSILSERNSLRQAIIFAPRGNIYDRNGILLASNKADQNHPDFPSRQYKDITGLGNLLGYVSYPKKDNTGVYYESTVKGVDGVELYFNNYLAGQNGTQITEVDALGNIQSENLLEPPRYGGTVKLSIDSRVQSELYDLIDSLSKDVGFDGGSAVIMDIHTGELLASVSYPEYKSQVMSDGKDPAQISRYVKDSRQPFLDRVTTGLYTPGSIVKPFVAVGALEEKVIDPNKKILSTGSISIPNSYDPTKKSVFTDWRPQGWVDMRNAIAVSSDVYFYEIGGGYEDQIGLGITNIEKYMRLFGFGSADQNNPLLQQAGTIPDPAWKIQNFKGDPWRVGDTYNTSIGQYGFQVTPLQIVRAMSSIANFGTLLEPTIVSGDSWALNQSVNLGLSADNIKVVQEGMRQGVTSSLGTAFNLNIPEVEIAAKTGTAELGTLKKYVNSWVTGFFPYKNPKFAFAAIMEHGPSTNTIGALYVMRQLFEWMGADTPEYLR